MAHGNKNSNGNFTLAGERAWRQASSFTPRQNVNCYNPFGRQFGNITTEP